PGPKIYLGIGRARDYAALAFRFKRSRGRGLPPADAKEHACFADAERRPARKLNEPAVTFGNNHLGVMRPGPNMKRQRGRNNGRKPHMPQRSQTFDSSGPDVRIRGNAYQVLEK